MSTVKFVDEKFFDMLPRLLSRCHAEIGDVSWIDLRKRWIAKAETELVRGDIDEMSAEQVAEQNAEHSDNYRYGVDMTELTQREREDLIDDYLYEKQYDNSSLPLRKKKKEAKRALRMRTFINLFTPVRPVTYTIDTISAKGHHPCTVTVVTGDHRISVGARVTISDVGDHDGTFTVTSVSRTSFTYETNKNPSERSTMGGKVETLILGRFKDLLLFSACAKTTKRAEKDVFFPRKCFETKIIFPSYRGEEAYGYSKKKVILAVSHVREDSYYGLSWSKEKTHYFHLYPLTPIKPIYSYRTPRRTIRLKNPIVAKKRLRTEQYVYTEQDPKSLYITVKGDGARVNVPEIEMDPVVHERTFILGDEDDSRVTVRFKLPESDFDDNFMFEEDEVYIPNISSERRLMNLLLWDPNSAKTLGYSYLKIMTMLEDAIYLRLPSYEKQLLFFLKRGLRFEKSFRNLVGLLTGLGGVKYYSEAAMRQVEIRY